MEDKQFVSKGGIKLQAAIENWKLNLENLTVLDVGSSTGGFVDCLLQNGAARVYSVDTCYGELAWKLRNNPKVVVMERTNILYLDHFPDHTPGESKPRPLMPKRSDGGQATPGVQEAKDNTSGVSLDSPEVDKVDLITIDAGWTKLELVLPVVKKFLKQDGFIIALLKPHYEANKKILRKGVVPEELVFSIKYRVLKEIEKQGFKIQDQMESPILGGAGNKEYLLLLFFKKDQINNR